jgi:hypothetical protein
MVDDRGCILDQLAIRAFDHRCDKVTDRLDNLAHEAGIVG